MSRHALSVLSRLVIHRVLSPTRKSPLVRGDGGFLTRWCPARMQPSRPAESHVFFQAATTRRNCRRHALEVQWSTHKCQPRGVQRYAFPEVVPMNREDDCAPSTDFLRPGSDQSYNTVLRQGDALVARWSTNAWRPPNAKSPLQALHGSFGWPTARGKVPRFRPRRS